MTANSDNDEKIDLDSAKDVEEVRKEFDEIIAENKQWMDKFKKLADSAKSGYVPTAKQFYSLAGLVYLNHVETLGAVQSIFDCLVSTSKELKEKTEKLEELKADLKETTQSPTIRRVNDFLLRTEAIEERKKKLEDELLDWATRSR